MPPVARPAPPRIYLAGPDVFRRDSAAVFADLKRRCEQLGLLGLEPSDGGLVAGFRGSDEALAQRIYEGNIALIRQADGVLANLADFRGLEPDSGTVFEIGYAVALDKPVVAYGVPAGSYAERVGARIACTPDAGGTLRETASGLMVEGLGQRANLMLTRSAELAPSAQAGLQRLAARLGARPVVQLRRFEVGDEPALQQVFHSAVHQTTARDYSPEQRAAWAPDQPDLAAWSARLQRNRPFVALLGEQIVGFADLQPDGQIDQFFVSARHTGLGVARQLMERLHAEAAALGLQALHADVSLTAEGFFARQGFVVLQRQTPRRNGVALRNAAMRKRLDRASPAYNPAA